MLHRESIKAGIGLSAIVGVVLYAAFALGGEPTPAARLQPPGHVVIVGGCSGVCVDPAGVILTAKHCGTDQSVTVRFPDGGQYPATLVATSREPEGTLAYQIDTPGTYPYAPVAQIPPQVGDAVYSWGYPGETEGAYTAGEITGFMSPDFGSAQFGNPKMVVVYTQPYCGPCEAFKREAKLRRVGVNLYAAEMYPGYFFRFADPHNAPDSIKSVPTFSYRGKRRVGYSPGTSAELLKWLQNQDAEHAQRFDAPTPSGVQLYSASTMATPGWSGGPLFNQRDEVIGICSVTDFHTETGWITHDDVTRVFQHAISRRGPQRFQRPEPQPDDNIATGEKLRELETDAEQKAKQIEELTDKIKSLTDSNTSLLKKIGTLTSVPGEIGKAKAQAAEARKGIEAIKRELDVVGSGEYPIWVALPAAILALLKRLGLNRGDA